jgi:hypothetical protein
VIASGRHVPRGLSGFGQMGVARRGVPGASGGEPGLQVQHAVHRHRGFIVAVQVIGDAVAGTIEERERPSPFRRGDQLTRPVEVACRGRQRITGLARPARQRIRLGERGAGRTLSGRN